MSLLSKSALVQGHVSVKRPLSIVPHGTVEVLDPALSGRSRLCRKYEGTYVVLVSDLSVTSTTALVVGQSQFHVSGNQASRLRGALLSIAGTEFVQVLDAEHVQLPGTSYMDTLVTSTKPLLSSYDVGETLYLLGFPVLVIDSPASGSMTITFESTDLLVAGDEFAEFHYEDDVPVLDDWQRILEVSDFTEYSDSENTTYFRYHCVLEHPLHKQLGATSSVYVKSVPAYQSKQLPVELSGSYHVDAYTGKVFGKGSDDLTLAITQYDENKSAFATSVFAKNDVLLVSAPNARDFNAWTVGNGTVSVQGDFLSSFNLDASGCFCIGIPLQTQHVRFQIKLTFPTTTTSTVVGFDNTLSTTSYYVKVRTGNGSSTQYLYDTATENVTVLDSSSTNPSLYAHTGPDFFLDLDQMDSDMIVLEISGPAGVSVPVQCLELGGIVTSYTVAEDPVQVPSTNYISYTYRADVNTAEAWEGSCLMLKPVYPSLQELYTDTDNLVLDSGQVLS